MVISDNQNINEPNASLVVWCINVLCCDLDVDECDDLYAMMKSKRMVNGIPVILCYKKGNTSYIPDDSVTGADPGMLAAFFQRCGVYQSQIENVDDVVDLSKLK